MGPVKNRRRVIGHRCRANCERLEERRLLAAVVSSTVFVPGKVSGLGVSGSDLINGLVPAPADTNYHATNEGGPLANLTDGKTAADPTNANEFSDHENSVFSVEADFSLPDYDGPRH